MKGIAVEEDDVNEPVMSPIEARAKVKKWQGEIDRSKKYFSDWHGRSKDINKRYRAQKPSDTKSPENSARFNLFWSMTETFRSLVYARTPKPDVSRRYKDEANKIAELAAVVLERACAFHLSTEPFDAVISDVVQDYLLTGRGTAWLRYDADFATDEEGYERISWEHVCVDFVRWEHFLHQPAERWELATWCARMTFKTRAELRKRFPREVADAVPLNYADGIEQKGGDTPDDMKQALVYEIWDKAGGEAIWIADGYADQPLDVLDDPLGLQGFFPCPRPLYGTMTTDSSVPVSDFDQMADQFDELDDLTNRIDVLTAALKNVGVCDASIPELQRLLKEGADNALIPVANWKMLQDKGGLDGTISWLPMNTVIETLMQLYDGREKVKAVIYEVSGMADVIRGISDPAETAAAQKLKGKWASVRVSQRQDDVQKFCRDIVRIMAEVIAEHFGSETLAQMTGISLPTAAEKMQIQQAAEFAQQQGGQLPPAAAAALEQPSIDDVVAVLRNDKMRTFVIDIETDSTIEPDEQQDKADRVEFARAMGETFNTFLPVVEKAPTLAPAVKELFMFVVRGFKAGRSVEDAFDQALGAAVQQTLQSQGQPDTETQLAQGTLQVEAAKVQQKAQKDAADAALKDKKINVDAAIAAEKIRVEEAKAHLSASAANEDRIADMAKTQMTTAAQRQRGMMQ